MSSNQPASLARRFLGFCVAVLAGIVLLYLATWLLSQFWGWLLLLGLVTLGIYLTVVIIRWRRSRW